jgi:hypothetical protein
MFAAQVEAFAILRTGNEAKAWEVAQRDEGLNEGVTFEQWISFARKCIVNADEIEAAYADHY